MIKLAPLALLLSAFASATAATPPQKVVFVGDQITANWPLTQTNPNWINQGVSGASSQAVAVSFQAAINQHPNVIHILVGLVDQLGETNVHSIQYPDVIVVSELAALQSMVQQAKAAGIQVVLGLEPLADSNPNDSNETNAEVAGFGEQQGIPVINYQNVSATPNTGKGTLPTADGYNEMTTLVESVLGTINLKLGGGYLQNMGYLSYPYAQLRTNENTIFTGSYFEFTAVGWYNDGSVHSLINPSLQGATGTWTSSNPMVLSIDQGGNVIGLVPGTSIVKYTSPAGVAFSEWIMYVWSNNGTDHNPVITR
jgi:hypothetical protein